MRPRNNNSLKKFKIREAKKESEIMVSALKSDLEIAKEKLAEAEEEFAKRETEFLESEHWLKKLFGDLEEKELIAEVAKALRLPKEINTLEEQQKGFATKAMVEEKIAKEKNSEQDNEAERIILLISTFVPFWGNTDMFKGTMLQKGLDTKHFEKKRKQEYGALTGIEIEKAIEDFIGDRSTPLQKSIGEYWDYVASKKEAIQKNEQELAEKRETYCIYFKAGERLFRDKYKRYQALQRIVLKEKAAVVAEAKKNVNRIEKRISQVEVELLEKKVEREKIEKKKIEERIIEDEKIEEKKIEEKKIEERKNDKVNDEQVKKEESKLQRNNKRQKEEVSMVDLQDLQLGNYVGAVDLAITNLYYDWYLQNKSAIKRARLFLILAIITGTLLAKFTALPLTAIAIGVAIGFITMVVVDRIKSFADKRRKAIESGEENYLEEERKKMKSILRRAIADIMGNSKNKNAISEIAIEILEEELKEINAERKKSEYFKNKEGNESESFEESWKIIYRGPKFIENLQDEVLELELLYYTYSKMETKLNRLNDLAKEEKLSEKENSEKQILKSKKENLIEAAKGIARKIHEKEKAKNFLELHKQSKVIGFDDRTIKYNSPDKLKEKERKKKWRDKRNWCKPSE